MKLLIDMNLSPRWVSYLAAKGFNATHWSQIADPGATDAEILAYAQMHEFVILTHDLDFGTMVFTNRHAGVSVIQLRAENLAPEAIGEMVLRTLTQQKDEIMRGALITIDGRRQRIRILPLNIA